MADIEGLWLATFKQAGSTEISFEMFGPLTSTSSNFCADVGALFPIMILTFRAMKSISLEDVDWVCLGLQLSQLHWADNLLRVGENCVIIWIAKLHKVGLSLRKSPRQGIYKPKPQCQESEVLRHGVIYCRKQAQITSYSVFRQLQVGYFHQPPYECG